MHAAAFKWWHLTARAEQRKAGKPLPEDDPEWQERIRHAKRHCQIGELAGRCQDRWS